MANQPPAQAGTEPAPRIRQRSAACMIGCLAACITIAAAGPCLVAQQGAPFPSSPPQNAKAKSKGKNAGNPQLPPGPQPAFSVPIEPLGFSTPGVGYLGERYTFVSLDFLDETHLLFTFRVPGLLHRDAADAASDTVRQIRAVVLSLPDGAISSEAIWTVHDRARYLWMLKDGHFLFRDRDSIQKGDATLVLKPELHFPGPILWMEMDPLQKYLVTNSREPADAPAKAGDVPSPPTAQADVSLDAPQHTADSQQHSAAPELVVRILDRASSQVMLVSRTRASIHLPINSVSYLETLRGNAGQWVVNRNYFSGGSSVIGHINTTCDPVIDLLSDQEMLAYTCSGSGRQIVAYSMDGHHLWEEPTPPQLVWPQLVVAPDGSRIARESLIVNHEVTAYSPIDAEDIKGQLVRVLDSATGKLLLQTIANPPLDAGGNVAFSPSAHRVAVINAGAIQVFDLPASPPASASAGPKPSH